MENSLKIESLQLQNFRFFADDENHNSFNLESKNTIIYGENGSGKSSIFKAFQFLGNIYSLPAQRVKSEFEQNINRFTDSFDDDEAFIKKKLNIDEEIFINEDSFTSGIDNSLYRFRDFNIVKPFVDFKQLLEFHFSHEDSINLYSIFRKIFADYRLEDGQKFSEIEDVNDYLNQLKNLLNDELLEYINSFVSRFDQNFQIDSFSSGIKFKDNFPSPFVNMKIRYQNEDISGFHLFLNEARLSALSISIYLAMIKRLENFQSENRWQLLILDDVLISLDMSNRMALLPILEDEFSEYQIIFLTHDRGLFELYKESFENKFELYLDFKEDIEVPYLKVTKEFSQVAKEHFHNRDYPASANYLRKEVEKLFVKNLQLDSLESIIEMARKVDNYDKIDKLFDSLVIVLKSFQKCETIPDNLKAQKCEIFGKKVLDFVEEIKNIISDNSFRDVNSIKARVLNPQSHFEPSTPLYKKELVDAFKIVEELKRDNS